MVNGENDIISETNLAIYDTHRTFELEPPYQVIFRGGHLANHVATLIVTKDVSKDDDDYAIHTHSHPVVAYGDEDYGYMGFDYAYGRRASQGVVWDKVELLDCFVLPLRREDRSMSLSDFCTLLFYALKDLGPDRFAVVDFLREYKSLGCHVDLPKKLSFTASMAILTYKDTKKKYVYSIGGEVMFFFPLDEDVEVMRQSYHIQLHAYAQFFERDITVKLKPQGSFPEEWIQAFGKETTDIPLA